MYTYFGKLTEDNNVELCQSQVTLVFCPRTLHITSFLPSVRSRESGDVLLFSERVLANSNMIKGPSQYAFVTRVLLAMPFRRKGGEARSG